MINVLITGAAGNLGSLLAGFILANEKDLNLILMEHQKKVPTDISKNPKVIVKQADLSKPETLHECLDGVDVIVHFAGVLFKANPEKFLPETNTQYFKNLVDVGREKNIKKIILISFPHVEGPTSRRKPAIGRLDGSPVSVHAQTRLAEEQYLFREVENPISLRVGMVYGKGILIFFNTVVAAIKNENAKGIYHIGDEGDDTLQSFLDMACEIWGYQKPWKMPLGLIYFAAYGFELISRIFDIKSPLTKDFIDIGRVSYFGDTSRFRRELLPRLKYRTVLDGIEELKG